MKSRIPFILPFLFVQYLAYSQGTVTVIDTIVYKQIDTTSLIMKVIYPPDMESDMYYPGMVFFFGGGWVRGTIRQFERQATYFADRGIVCFLADYRVESRHGTTIFECIADAKSAVRCIRENADRFQVDESKIIAAGGSAGGHLAAATALVKGFNDQNDHMGISPVPNALVLYNPVLDLSPEVQNFYKKAGDKYKEVSPINFVKKGSPPAIIFLGEEDRLIPVESMVRFKKEMEEAGNRCDLFLYEGQGHGFFNYGVSREHYYKTLRETERFLVSLGYIKNGPIVQAP